MGSVGSRFHRKATIRWSTEQTLQVGDTQIFGTKVVNETRFQYLRDESTPDAAEHGAERHGSLGIRWRRYSGGLVNDNTNQYEFQNYTSIQFTKHFVKFGARLRGYTDGNIRQGASMAHMCFHRSTPILARCKARLQPTNYTVRQIPPTPLLRLIPLCMSRRLTSDCMWKTTGASGRTFP